MSDDPISAESWWQRRAAVVLALAELIPSERLPTGERAALRRLAPDDYAASPAFWRLMIERVPEELRQTLAAESRWAMLLHGLAEVHQAHQQKEKLGRVLAETNWSEARMEQLLRARDAQFWPTLRRMWGVLAVHARPLDWVDAADFVLADSESAAERCRHRIARDYYTMLARPAP